MEHLLDREDDVFDLRDAVVLQDFSIWHGDINTRHPGDRSIQVVEGGAWRERQGKSKPSKDVQDHCRQGALWAQPNT